MSENNLIELADRCEAATGPDRELDAEIALAADYECPNTLQTIAVMMSWSPLNTISEIAKWSGAQQTAFVLPRYTASLDAAMTLVPEGDGVGFQVARGSGMDCSAGVWGITPDPAIKSIDGFPIIDWQAGGKATAPALALCAATLRARAALGDAS